MKKFLILMLSIGILSCANNKTEQVSTIKIKDEKAQKISEMMKSYVSNNLNSSIISDDAKIKFNQLEMTKSDFENLVNTHHAMFSEISFPEGWMETVNYTGADIKMQEVTILKNMEVLGQVIGVIGQLYRKSLATQYPIPAFLVTNGRMTRLW